MITGFYFLRIFFTKSKNPTLRQKTQLSRHLNKEKTTKTVQIYKRPPFGRGLEYYDSIEILLTIDANDDSKTDPPNELVRCIDPAFVK